MNILGISAYYHDSAACLVKDGQISAAAQEERFTRKKHDEHFPQEAVNSCLIEGGLTLRELDYVVFYEKPFLKFDRILHTFLDCAPSGLRTFLKAMPLWLRHRIWMKSELQEALAGFSGPILFAEHHESHAASAFFPSPFDEAAFLTVDGVGEWTTTSYGMGRGNRIELHSELRFPHSLGLLYSAFTYYAGFRVNSGEYKLMGLAPYGTPKYKDLILRDLVDLKPDGSFRLNLDYFDFLVGQTMTNDRFHRLFGGPPRVPESKLTQRDMDLARSIQDVTEEMMFRMARHVRAQTGMRNLCLAGGVALNCVANGRILREGVFDKIWIQPAAGDAGGALGAALLAWYQYLDNPRQPAPDGSDAQRGSYLGPRYSDDAVRAFLEREHVPFVELAESEIPEKIADLIAAENVVGWFQGRMEFGPRALGARSILGDARSPRMQEIMNLKIKFRESFRPFAPSVLRERVQDFFDLTEESPYMLLVAPVSERIRCPVKSGEELPGLAQLHQVRSILPAVTHVDFSARVQTVTEKNHPLFYRLLRQFDQKYGCPVIINTSFNVRGEPIVCTPEHAYTCFMRTNMDYLLLNRFLLKKKEQKPLERDLNWLREFELD